MKKSYNDLFREEPKYPNQQLQLTVPLTPSVNHMYINTKSGGRILNKDAKEYIKKVQEACREAMLKANWKQENEHVWYGMDLYFYFPDRRIRDSHNCIKLLMDCLEGILFNNDYYVMPRIKYVSLDKDNPRIEIFFYPAES